ncbi:MAG: hypothetical protein J1E78_03325, partial [Muribaculaceae bacterium]|nr:hypothetical protein [Muribaculaceae bacterium]
WKTLRVFGVGTTLNPFVFPTILVFLTDEIIIFPGAFIECFMMKNIEILCFLTLTFMPAEAQKVYDTHNESRADVKVFVVDKDYRADLVVFTTNTDSRAKDNRGIWFIEHTESRADKKICFVNAASRADLKVYFTNTESRAGWRNPEKKALMEK